MDRINWHQAHMMLCYTVAMRSPDPSTKLGAVIVAPDNRVVASGYNGWPRGVKPFAADDPRWERPLKYAWMAHAERNALDNALRAGTGVEGCTLYNPICPCIECARGIVQAGIREVVIHAQAHEHFMERMVGNQTWATQLEIVKQMFAEAGVTMRQMYDAMPRFESFINGDRLDVYQKHPKGLSAPIFGNADSIMSEKSNDKTMIKGLPVVVDVLRNGEKINGS